MKYILVIFLLTGPQSLKSTWTGPYISEIECTKAGEVFNNYLKLQDTKDYKLLCIPKVET